MYERKGKEVMVSTVYLQCINISKAIRGDRRESDNREIYVCRAVTRGAVMTAAALSVKHSHTPHTLNPQAIILNLVRSNLKQSVHFCVYDVRLLNFIGQVQHIVKTHHRV
jgi:hypothetical protein